MTHPPGAAAEIMDAIDRVREAIAAIDATLRKGDQTQKQPPKRPKLEVVE
jgi:hypothetical protein